MSIFPYDPSLHSVFECQMTQLSPLSGSESEENNGVSRCLNTETVSLGTEVKGEESFLEFLTDLWAYALSM